MLSSWVRYHFQHLKRWREYAQSIARATLEIVPNAKVYVVGGVAEERTTIYSDIDVLIVLPEGVERKNLYVRILTKAMDKYGLPLDAPVELHITTKEEARHYMKSKIIEVEP